jgi:hypothetical protein
MFTAFGNCHEVERMGEETLVRHFLPDIIHSEGFYDEGSRFNTFVDCHISGGLNG